MSRRQRFTIGIIILYLIYFMWVNTEEYKKKIAKYMKQPINQVIE